MPSDEKYISVTAPDAASPEDALQMLHARLAEKLAEAGMTANDLVLIRFFSSDAARHARLMDSEIIASLPAQKVLIGQAPLDSRYLSMQAWALKEQPEKVFLPDGSMLLRHGPYTSLWSLDEAPRSGDSEKQTDEILASLESRLFRHGMSLESNVVRTWYYMRDVDNNYAGMIKSRVRHYEIHGLNSRTHFIASTGIEGQTANPAALAWLHSHAIQGLEKGQIKYLRALDNMSPTAIYGVNFERGTAITYGDRKHAHISGTASINARGEVLFRGNVQAQTERALENIGALLREADMGFGDMQAVTVYCRDAHDYGHVREIVKHSLPAACAVNFTHAPVCRPDWLVEMEGEAVKAQKTGEFANFL